MEQFTRWVNLQERRHKYGVPVLRVGDPQRSALIAETGFEIAMAPYRHDGDEIRSQPSELVSRMPGGSSELPLTASESFEAVWVGRNIRRFLPDAASDHARQVVAQPRFPGCGFVLPADGDILIGSHLVEVKSVERGFRGIDFRQALTYAALAYASGTAITEITLVNPRRAVFHRSFSASLSRDLGAASWIELMHNLVNAMAEVGPSQ